MNKIFSFFLLAVVLGPLAGNIRTARSDTLPEIKVTASVIAEPEYDQDNARFVFSDNDGILWIGNVDHQTGEFNPKDGHAVLVDTSAAHPADFGNGPEWLFTSAGHEIVYTKYRD